MLIILQDIFLNYINPHYKLRIMLYISLSEIGRISNINQIKIINYIMSRYNHSSYIFNDDYSRRYLDINISKTYYLYTSLLEVNCYATSLHILNRLDLIDVQESIDFICSCYQPITSGFIGQSYESEYLVFNEIVLFLLDYC